MGARSGEDFAESMDAVTTLEYGIICAFFAVLLVGIFSRFGATLTLMFSGVANSL